jgi:hypothetical protein
VRAGLIPEAVELQLKLIPLFDLMLTRDFPDGFRAAASLRGFDLRRSPSPRLDGSPPGFDWLLTSAIRVLGVEPETPAGRPDGRPT